MRGSPELGARQNAPVGVAPPPTVSTRMPTMKPNVTEDNKGTSSPSEDGDFAGRIVAELRDAVEFDESPGKGQALYVIAHHHGFYKIGLSTDPIRRVREIQEYCPYDVELISFSGFRNSQLAEEILHDHFDEQHVRGEWFEIHDEIMPLLFDREERSLEDVVKDHEAYPGLGGEADE